MKRLLVLILTVVSIKAQTTNIDIRITVREPTITNQMTRTISQSHVQGFMLSWQRDIMLAQQQTNAAPSFFTSVTNELTTIILPLKQRSDDDEISTNGLNIIIQNIPQRWATATIQQKTNFVNASKALGQ